MGKKKEASTMPAPEEPIDLTKFGAIRYEGGGIPEQWENLTLALVHIHDNITGVRLYTKFRVVELRVTYGDDDKGCNSPERNGYAIILTHAELLEDWRIWNKDNGHQPFNPDLEYKKANDGSMYSTGRPRLVEAST